jgi:hypothetical protein
MAIAGAGVLSDTGSETLKCSRGLEGALEIIQPSSPQVTHNEDEYQHRLLLRFKTVA